MSTILNPDGQKQFQILFKPAAAFEFTSWGNIYGVSFPSKGKNQNPVVSPLVIRVTTTLVKSMDSRARLLGLGFWLLFNLTLGK